MSGTGIYAFDYDAWAALFPELALSIGGDQAAMYFQVAETLVDNSPCSVIPMTSGPSTPRATILNLTTAHIAALVGSLNGQPANPLVGRISNASEGSVSVQVEYDSTKSAAWWNQSKYGALAWQAQAPYRMALYGVAPQVPRSAQSWPGGAGFGVLGGRMFFPGLGR